MRPPDAERGPDGPSSHSSTPRQKDHGEDIPQVEDITGWAALAAWLGADR